MSKKETESVKVTFFDLISASRSYKLAIDLDTGLFIISYLLILIIFMIFNLLKFCNIWGVIIFTIFSFLTSLLVMKPERFVEVKFFKNNQKESDINERKNNKVLLKILLRKLIVVFPRFAFFNVLYNFFPIFIIFVASILLFHILGVVTISNASNFIQITTLTSIILGFFQYYLRRYEDRIQQTINAEMVSFMQVVVKEASFANFRKFLNKRSRESSGSRNIYSDILKIIKKTTENQVYRFMDKRRPGKEIIYYQPQFIVSGGDDFLFSLLESEVEEDEEKKQQLIKVYKEFFKDVEESAKEKLKKDARRIEELAKLLFSNINITSEAKIRLIDIIGDLEKYDEPSSYTQFLIKTNYNILNEIMTKILFGRRE